MPSSCTVAGVGLSLVFCLLVVAGFRSIESPYARLVSAIPVDPGIAKFEARLRKNPKDYLSGSILASLYIAHAGRSGDIEYYKKAERLAAGLVEIAPDHPGSRIQHSRALAALHRFQESEREARAALVHKPGDLSARLLIADALLEQGEYAAAREAVAELDREEPDTSVFVARLAKLTEIFGDAAAAKSGYERALRLARSEGERGDALAWYHGVLGDFHFRHGDLAFAEKEYATARKLAPQSPFALAKSAELAAAQRNREQAKLYFDELLKAAPRPDVVQAYGEMLHEFGEDADAHIALSYAEEKYLKSVDAGEIHYLHHLAGLYGGADPKPAHALLFATKDAETRHTVEALDALAWAQFETGKRKEAADTVQRYLPFASQNATALDRAAKILAETDPARSAELAAAARAVNPLLEALRIHVH